MLNTKFSLAARIVTAIAVTAGVIMWHFTFSAFGVDSDYPSVGLSVLLLLSIILVWRRHDRFVSSTLFLYFLVSSALGFRDFGLVGAIVSAVAMLVLALYSVVYILSLLGVGRVLDTYGKEKS